MTKNELIMNISNQTGLPTTSCESVLDVFAKEIQNCLAKGDKLILKGFMSFEVSERPERRGRNPQTKEVIMFPAVKTIKCRASKAMKEAVNAGVVI